MNSVPSPAFDAALADTDPEALYLAIPPPRTDQHDTDRTPEMPPSARVPEDLDRISGAEVRLALSTILSRLDRIEQGLAGVLSVAEGARGAAVECANLILSHASRAEEAHARIDEVERRVPLRPSLQTLASG